MIFSIFRWSDDMVSLSVAHLLFIVHIISERLSSFVTLPRFKFR